MKWTWWTPKSLPSTQFCDQRDFFPNYFELKNKKPLLLLLPSTISNRPIAYLVIIGNLFLLGKNSFVFFHNGLCMKQMKQFMVFWGTQVLLTSVYFLGLYRNTKWKVTDAASFLLLLKTHFSLFQNEVFEFLHRLNRILLLNSNIKL